MSLINITSQECFKQTTFASVMGKVEYRPGFPTRLHLQSYAFLAKWVGVLT